MMLLHLPTQIFFRIGGDRVTWRGSKLTNSRGLTNLNKGNNNLNLRRARQVVPLEIASFFPFWSVFELGVYRDRADLDTSFLTLKRVHNSLKSKYIYTSASIFAVFCLIFNRSLKLFECAFPHPIILSLSYLVKNSRDGVSVICKLALKWYVMRMCAS